MLVLGVLVGIGDRESGNIQRGGREVGYIQTVCSDNDDFLSVVSGCW